MDLQFVDISYCFCTNPSYFRNFNYLLNNYGKSIDSDCFDE